MQETTLDQVTPLCKAQGRAGATFASFDGWQLPKSYGKTKDEYQAARKAVALADRSHLGRLRITGADGLDLLNRLSTNKLIGMSTGEGASTVLTTNQGRIIDLLLVINRGDELLVLTSPQTPSRVAEWIDLYTFGENIAVENITEETALLSLIGPRAGDLLGPHVPALGLYGTVQIPLQGLPVTVIRTDAQGIAGYDLLVPASRAEEVWEALLQAGPSPERAGVMPVGADALEVLRVEQGVPLYGRELGEDFNPLEAGLTSSISFEKGCYIGQEVVLRLNTYKKVQRHLKGIVLEEGMAAPGARLEVDGRDVGFLTSVVDSPLLRRTLALGYVRASYASAGQEVGVRSGEQLAPGKVIDLPVEKVQE